jgi:hypothetical protein
MFRLRSNRPSRPPVANNNRDAADDGVVPSRAEAGDLHGVTSWHSGQFGQLSKDSRHKVKRQVVATNTRIFAAFARQLIVMLVCNFSFCAVALVTQMRAWDAQMRAEMRDLDENMRELYAFVNVR